MVRDSFAAFILSHGRAKETDTVNTILKAGYTGKWYIVLDDMDDSAPQYFQRFGRDHCIIFDKKAVAGHTDAGDNLGGYNACLWARNACFDIARRLGIKYFQELDDDYFEIQLKSVDRTRTHLYGRCLKDYDRAIEMACDLIDDTGAYAVSFAQGGDWIGGAENRFISKPITRKCMNSWICRTDREIAFRGRMNDDVSTYLRYNLTGKPMFSIMPITFIQPPTQQLAGGMTELYKDTGTYQKTFYSIMYAPSCVKVGAMGRKFKRLHHNINWENCAVKIIDEKWKKK